MKTARLVILILLSIAALSGCTIKPVERVDLLAQRKPTSILVIPPLNNTVEVNAPYTLLSSISRPLAEKGYYVFPVSVIETMFRENGLPTTAEMNTIPLEKIREIINPDVVLYISIDRWGQEYQIISSQSIVSSHWRIVDAQDGTTLWEGHASAVKSDNNGNNGLAFALIGALVDQIAGSIVDHTPALSKQASKELINSSYRGLPPGPYTPKEEEN